MYLNNTINTITITRRMMFTITDTTMIPTKMEGVMFLPAGTRSSVSSDEVGPDVAGGVGQVVRGCITATPIKVNGLDGS